MRRAEEGASDDGLSVSGGKAMPNVNKALICPLLAIILILTLSGCALLQRDEEVIDFHKIIGGSMQVLKEKGVVRLDTDDDEREEWVVFYRYDLGPGRSPIGGAVYDVDTCRPPGIAAYELRPLDYDYLGEQSVTPEMRDLWPGDGDVELLVWGHGGGTIEELSIFRWFDETKGCVEPLPGQRGYEVLGSWRGTGGITLNGTRVVVKDRDGFERSQLAIKRVYEPDAASRTYIRDGRLVEPVERSIDFTYGQPITPTQSYYPEKAVLSFYLLLGQDKQNLQKAQSLLFCENSTCNYIVGEDSFGIPLPPKEIQRVLVKEIAYQPDVEAERLHRTRQVEVTLAWIRKGEKREAPGRVRVRWWVRASPKKGALPYDCEWKLDRYQVVP